MSARSWDFAGHAIGYAVVIALLFEGIGIGGPDVTASAGITVL